MKTQKFKSKISYSLAIFVFLSIGIPTVILVIAQQWMASIIMVPCFLFVLHLYLKTYYVVNKKDLLINSGLLVHQKVDIEKIISLKDSRSILSSPALSLDRLEVKYGKYNTVLISPKRKEEFIELLQKLNPEIKYLPS